MSTQAAIRTGIAGVIAIIAMSLYLFVSRDDGTISKKEAIANVQNRAGIVGVLTDEEAEGMMVDMCMVLDAKTPAQFINDLEFDRDPYPFVVIMDNATQSYCPEHAAAVKFFIDSS